MRLLLDTHVAIWAVNGDRLLRDDAVAMIADPVNEVAVSIVSLWEIAIKNNLRRPRATTIGLSVRDATEQFAAASFQLVGLDVRHMEPIETLPRLHGDPFDRMLVALARVDRFWLVTHDRALAAYGDHVLVV